MKDWVLVVPLWFVTLLLALPPWIGLRRRTRTARRQSLRGFAVRVTDPGGADLAPVSPGIE